MDVLGLSAPAPDTEPVNKPDLSLADLTIAMSDASEDERFLSGVVWSGRVNAGAVQQSGNSDKQNVNLDGTVKAKWTDHRVTLKAEYAREEDNDEKAEDNRKAAVDWDYFFAPQWFSATNPELETDDIAELDQRLTLGLGLGHQPFEAEGLSLSLVLGFNYLDEEFNNGTGEDSIAYNWSLDYEHALWDALFTLYHEHRLLVPSDETHRYVVDTKTGLRAPLRDGLIASFEVEHDVDKGVPEGSSETDTTYGIKLGYEW